MSPALPKSGEPWSCCPGGQEEVGFSPCPLAPHCPFSLALSLSTLRSHLPPFLAHWPPPSVSLPDLPGCASTLPVPPGCLCLASSSPRASLKCPPRHTQDSLAVSHSLPCTSFLPALAGYCCCLREACLPAPSLAAASLLSVLWRASFQKGVVSLLPAQMALEVA